MNVTSIKRALFNLVLPTAALLMMASPASGQTGLDALRFSQRQPLASPQLMGSAGAGIAGRGDIGDLFLNPAGLGFMDRGSFSVSLNTMAAQDDAIYSVGSGPAFASSADLTATRLGNISYAYKFPTRQGSMVFGAGIAQTASFARELNFDGENGLNSITDYMLPLSDEYDLFDEGGSLVPEFYRTLSFIGYETFAIDLDQDAAAAGSSQPFLPAVSAGRVLQTGLVSEEGQMSEFSVGGAVEAARDVMVGLSLNVPYGQYRFNRLFSEEDIYNDNDGTGGTTDFDYLSFSEGFESTLVGVNLRAGVSAKLNDNVRFGFSVETPTYYTVSEDFDTQLFTSFDNGDSYRYGDTADEDAGYGSFDYQIKTPWRLGLGLGYRMGGLTLDGDLELVDWSQLELDSDGYSFADENLAIRRDLESTVNVRLAAAYRFDKLTLRLGINGQPDARANVTGPNRDRGMIAFGLSYEVNNQFAFDMGLMAEGFKDQYSPYTEVDSAPVVDEEVGRGFFSLGVRIGL